MTGNTNVNLFIKDLKNKWEDAYRKESNTINEINYSIQTSIDGNKFVNTDTDQNLFEGKSLLEQAK